MLYSECKIYGPYTRKSDNYSHVVAIYPNGERKTISYAKYLIECLLGRTLEPNEEVHHIDENPRNNVLSNLEVKSVGEHRREHVTKYFTESKVRCVYCGVEFTLSIEGQRNRTRNANKGKNGPFCSKRCTGKYSMDAVSVSMIV